MLLTQKQPKLPHLSPHIDPLSQITITKPTFQTENFIKEIKEPLQKVSKLTSFPDRDIILFFGKSGSGTSTLINYLENSEIFSHSEGNTKFFIQSNKPATKIRAGDQQETTFPVRVEDKLNKLVYWDCGSFPDMKKPSEEVPYVSVIRKIIKQTNRVKIIFTMSYEELDKKPEELFSALELFRGTFSEPQFLTSSLFLVITKAPSTKTLLMLKHKLENFAQWKKVHSDTKKIISGLLKNSAFEMFYAPDNTGRVDDESKKNILKKLQDLQYFQREKVGLKVSDQSNELIRKIVDDTFQGFDMQIKALVEAIEDIYQGNLRGKIDADDYYRLKDFQEKLEEIHGSGNLIEFAEKIRDLIESEDLKDLSDEVKNFSEEISFAMNLMQVSPIITLDTNPWYAKIEALEQELSDLLKTEEIRIGEKTIIIKGFFVSLAEINKPWEACSFYHGISNANIEIYAYSAILLDQDIKGEGQNLTIVSPQWIVVGPKRLIDLSGHDARNPPQNLYGLNILDGMPGSRGDCSGHFLGIGSKFEGMQNLTIRANGGKGGPGGKGKDGTNGKGGMNGDKMAVENLELRVLKSSTPMNASVLGMKKTYQEVYESKGTPGSNGTNGGKGGQGGFGGYFGEVRIIGVLEKELPKIERQMGRKGEDGEGGKAGKGGIGGYSFCGLYINEKFMGMSRGQNSYWKTSPFEYKEQDGKDGIEFIEEKNSVGIQGSLRQACNQHEEAARQQWSKFVEDKRAAGFRFLSSKL